MVVRLTGRKLSQKPESVEVTATQKERCHVFNPCRTE